MKKSLSKYYVLLKFKFRFGSENDYEGTFLAAALKIFEIHMTSYTALQFLQIAISLYSYLSTKKRKTQIIFFQTTLLILRSHFIFH